MSWDLENICEYMERYICKDINTFSYIPVLCNYYMYTHMYACTHIHICTYVYILYEMRCPNKK